MFQTTNQKYMSYCYNVTLVMTTSVDAVTITLVG
jgi:hypothetical protein